MVWSDRLKLGACIIVALYGGCHPSPHLGGRPSGLRGVSSWWSNISLLGEIERLMGTGFQRGLLG